jgi:DNA primase large subunit
MTYKVSPYELARYPFMSAAESYLRQVGFTLEDAAAQPILSRSKERILSAIERRKVDLNLSDTDREIISFYVAMLIVKGAASNWLNRVFARAEGERAKEAFKQEEEGSVCNIINNLFGMNLEVVKRLPFLVDEATAPRIKFVAPVSSYLQVTSELQQLDNPRLALIENYVDGGKIYLTREKLIDLIRDQFSALVLKNLRRMQSPTKLPKELLDAIEEMKSRVPKPSGQPSSTRFQYIEKILQTNIQDGRHRILWLILPPYMVNVKHMSEDEALEAIKSYMERCGWREPRAERIIRYNVRRAKRIGLMPPTLERLEQTSPGLYKIITESIR